MPRTPVNRRKKRRASPFATVRDLRSCGFTVDQIKRVEAKERGAGAARTGFAYEDAYATVTLVKGCRQVAQRGREVAVAEGRGAFVDDVIIEERDIFAYHQLKTGKGESWTRGDRALERDFVNQATVCLRKGLPFQLLLVVPSATLRKKLERKMPATLQRTKVVRFPVVSRVADLARVGKTEADLDALLAFERPGPSDRENVLKHIYFGWVERRDRSRFLRASRLLRTLREEPYAFVARPFRDDSAEWRKAKRILDAIPNLVVTIDRGYFCYDHLNGVMRGHEVRCGTKVYRSLVSRIVSAKPRTFAELEALL